ATTAVSISNRLWEASRVPLDLCASGTRARSRPVHSVISREKPSKRTKETGAESRAEAGVEEPVEAGVEDPAVEARLEEPAVEAGLEAVPEAGEAFPAKPG